MKKLLVLAGATLVGSAFATDFFETEANDNKASANVVAGIVSGDQIRGTTTGSSTTVAGLASADNFRVSTAAAALGIYQHRLTIVSASTANTGSIRGTNQVASAPDTMAGLPWDGVSGTFGGTSDGAFGSTSSTIRYNQWYGFGKGEQVYYRMAGTTATTAEYIARYSMTQITPTFIGTYQAGNITMDWNGQGHTTDTDMWVYDGNLNAIAGYGNDDSSAALAGAPVATSSLQSFLYRSYAPGTYYIAVSNFSFGNEMAAASDDNFRTGTITDFANVAANNSTSTGNNMQFSITDGVTSNVVANTKLNPFDVNWFQFNVVPEPGTFVALGIGLAALAASRRRK